MTNRHCLLFQAIEFEEQNAILQKHVENMKSAIAKLEQETGQQQDNNSALEKHLVRDSHTWLIFFPIGDAR